MASNEEKIDALLKDLQELSVYLHGRGVKTLAISKQFEANAKKDPGNREYDLNQARMLDYQHNLFHEFGNLVDKLMKKYDG